MPYITILYLPGFSLKQFNENTADVQPSQTTAHTSGIACIFLLSILSFQTLTPTEVLLTSVVLQIYKKHIFTNYFLNLQSPFNYLQFPSMFSQLQLGRPAKQHFKHRRHSLIMHCLDELAPSSLLMPSN